METERARRGRTPAEVVADNVRDYRSLRRLKQREVADRMRSLGHRWHAKTVSVVESSQRPVTTNEVVALALVLEVTISDLFDPTGADGSRTDGYYLGDLENPAEGISMPSLFAQHVARSQGTMVFDGRSVFRKVEE